VIRFSYAEAMIDPSFYGPLARAAEEAGFDSFVVPESIVYPRDSTTGYPYVEGGGREFLEDKPFIDPFVLAGSLSLVTERLRFVTFVVKLPLRHPVLAAKQAASVSVVSGGRFALGVGLSPWPEDYEGCGQPWPSRGPRMDEQLDIIDGLCAGGYFEYHGSFYDLAPVKICPVPTARLPILVGGHAPAALERAARWDGWLHAGSESGRLGEMIGSLRSMRRRLGRADETFEIHVISLDGYSVDGCRRLEALGVTDVIIGFRDPYRPGPDTEPLPAKLEAIARFGERVIGPVKG
jgi:probable F420-dependent oxidoreductase